MTRAYAVVRILALLLLPLCAQTSSAQTTGWLDNDPNAIWSRPPGFYEDSGHWYAVLHTRPDVERVRLVGEFTDEESDAIDLTRTPDGKFWWFKGTEATFARPPAAGDKYNFVLTGPDGSDLRVQDPAARQVENSSLSARSIVTVSDAYAWQDQAWQRPGWEYYLIYQLHPLRFSNRNESLTPLQRITEELDGDGSDDYVHDLGVTAVQLLPVICPLNLLV